MSSKIIPSLLLLLLLPVAALAITWPLPAKTPLTDVPCPDCPGSTPTNILKTPGYPPVLTTFVGRYLDSQGTPDHQQTFRTARATSVFFVPARNRVYMLIGSALFAYNLDTFFSRLGSGEMLMSASEMPPSNALYCPPCESFLHFDQFFYAEYGSGWTTPQIDGQDRLFHFDWDDRGNVLLAYSVFGWGIVRDDRLADRSEMASVFQYLPTLPTDITPFDIMSVKTSDNSYYALVHTAADATRTDVWDVTDAANPVSQGSQNRGFSAFAKSSAEATIAVIDGFNNVSIFTADNLARNGPPSSTFMAPGGVPFLGMATDGTNFFSTYEGINGLIFAEFVPAGGGQYQEVDIPTPPVPNINSVTAAIRMTVVKLRYDSGFLTLSGIENGVWDVHLFRLSGQQVSFLDVNHYFARYYYASASPGYTHPDTAYINITDTWTYRFAAHTYVVLAAKGLGDVYEMADSGGPSIVSINPATGPADGGTSVDISGSNLNGASITFGGVAASVITTSNTLITVSSPAHDAGSVDVVAQNGNGSDTRAGGFMYFLSPVSGVTAATLNASSISVAYSLAAHATSYEIWRRTDLGPLFTMVGTSTTAVYQDNSVVAGHVYLYKVRAADTHGHVSAFSAIDWASTMGFVFSDDPLVSGLVVKAVHLSELRTDVNTVRLVAGLLPTVFTDPQLQGNTCQAVHLNELRSSLNEARVALGLPALVYTDALIVAGTTPIRTVHFQEIRNALKK